MGIGMALTGMRPIVEIMFSDFMLVAMDQIVNQMAKVCYMSGGQKNVPMVIRTTIGAGRAAAAQHSQNLNAVIAHFPGSKIVIPSDAYTAKGLLKSAIRDNNPVIVVEHRKHYSVEFDMPDDGDENLLLPIGRKNPNGINIITFPNKLVNIAKNPTCSRYCQNLLISLNSTRL